MAYACSHNTTHEHSTQSGAQRHTHVPTCTRTFSHMQKHTQANGTLTNIHVHRPVLTETHSHMCRHIHLCTHTHIDTHLPGWSQREGICLPMPCFRPLGFWAHAHFHHRKKIIFRQTLLSASGNVLSHCFLHNPSPIRPQSQIFPFQRKITLPKLGSTCM